MKKKKTEILLASRKAWKRAVRFLSCMVVFCTVYALILPAITQEAKAYCGSTEHKHTDECYTEILSCTREEHSHSKECYDEEGSLICEAEEHQHTESCYRKVFDCTEEEHTHSLICFSDPAADLETEKDWEKSLPKEKKETTRENVIEIAKSQENVAESTKNYEVDSETEIRGISRYGQWDGKPYENWTGAFARFVLVSAGISPEKIYSENDVIDWMNELNKKEQLSAISEGKEGDVVFIYDKEEEIHAGIILSMDEKENSFTAMMGDWGNKVSRQKFSLEDDKIHSIFRLPVTDDKEEEVKEVEDEPAAEEPDSKDAENEIKEDPADKAVADKEETEKRETNDSAEESKNSSDAEKKAAELNKSNQLTDEIQFTASWKTDELSLEKADLTIAETEISSDEKSELQNELGLRNRDQLIRVDLSTKSKENGQNSDNTSKLDCVLTVSNSEEKEIGIAKILDFDSKKEIKITSEVSKDSELFRFSSEPDSSILVVYTDSEVFDYTQSYETSDGSLITASWNEEAFKNSENVRMQAEKVDLEDEEFEKLQNLRKEKLSEDKESENRKFVSYDIQFFVDGKDGELIEVEPSEAVRVSVQLKKRPNAIINNIWHHLDNGQIEQIEKDQIKKADQTEIEFNQNSFSVDTVEFTDDSGIELQSGEYGVDSVWKMNEGLKANNTQFKLYHNVEQDADNADNNKNVYINNGKTITLDLNGHYWKIKGTIFVSNGSKLVIKNSNTNYKSKIYGTVGNNKWGTTADNNADSLTRVQYKTREGEFVYAEAGGLITSAGNVIRVDGKNSGEASNESSVTVEDGAAIISDNGTGILADNRANVVLNESYICSCGNGGVELYFGSSMTLNKGSVISLNKKTNGRGGGIFTTDIKSSGGGQGSEWFGTKLTMNDGSLVSSNESQSGGGISIGRLNSNIPAEDGTENFARSCLFTMNGGVIAGNHSTLYEGGGLALQNNSRSRAVLFGGEFYKNSVNTDDWGGGGIFCALGNYLWMPNGASIYDNTAAGLGGGLTGCATGKLIIDPTLLVFQNTANATNFGKESDKPKVYNYKKQVPGYYGTEEGYKGEDIFGAEKSQVTGQFTYNGQTFNADWQGNVDKFFTTDKDGTTLNSTDWITLKCMLPDSQTDQYKANKLIIHENTSSSNAGGVLINGWLVTGSVDTTYLGKSLEVEAYKKLIDEGGETLQMTPRQFAFKITEINDQNAPALLTGYNNGVGKIIFDGKLPVGDTSETKYTFYMMEDLSKMPPGYAPGNEVYQIDVSVTELSRTTFYMPVWDAGAQAYVSKAVTVVERQISSISYKEISGNHSNTVSGTEKVTIGSSQNQPFTNTEKDKTSVSVVKEWSDSEVNNHSSDVITVELYDADTNKVFDTQKLSTANGWSYTWEDLSTVDSDNSGRLIQYSVRETNVPEGYVSQIHSLHVEGQPGTDTQAWLPAYSIDDGAEYLVISGESNKGLLANGLNLQMVDISNYKLDGIDAYSTSIQGISSVVANTAYGMKNSAEQSIGNITALNIKGTSNYLASRSSHPGLQALSNNSDPRYWKSADRGFSIDNQDANLIITDSTEKSYGVVTNGTQIGTDNYLSGTTKVQLYKKGTIKIGKTNTGTQFTITNTKIDNSLTVLKTDDNPNENDRKLLSGAEFGLYSSSDLSSASKLKFNKSDDGAYTYSKDGTTDVLVTNSDGTFEVTNIPSGSYYLKETKAPSGYSITDGTPVLITYNNDPSSGSDAKPVISISKTIQNTLLTYELPETGSSGTMLYKAAGSAMILAAISLYGFNRKKRREGED